MKHWLLALAELVALFMLVLAVVVTTFAFFAGCAR